MAKETGSAGRGASPAVFLYPVIGILAVGNVVFALLWLLNPIASGPSGERGGRRIEVTAGRRVLRIGEGVSVEGPRSGYETRLSGEQFDELVKTLAKLTSATRTGEQAAEFFRGEAGREARPAVTLSFPRRGLGAETLEVYAIDTRRQAVYCRLGSTGEPLAIKLDIYQKIASELAGLAGGAVGSLAVPYYTPLDEAFRAQLQKLQAPLVVTTVSPDPRQYLLQTLSNPLAGLGGVRLEQPDRSTLMISVRLPDDEAMTRSLADAMAAACDKVKVQHLDFASQTAAVQEFARSIKRTVNDIEDAIVLQYGGRVRLIRNTELLAREEAGPLAVAAALRFEGEKVLARALDDLLAERGLVYFAEGHGERRIADRAKEGLSQAVEQLNARGFRVAPLDLATARALPSDCQVLALAGPRKPLAAEAEKAIAAYLDGGGRLAVFLDPPDGIVPLADTLKRFGLTVPEPRKVVEARGLNPPVAIELELNAKLDFVAKWTREATVLFTAAEVAVAPPAEGADYEVLRVARPAEAEEGSKAPCLLAAVRPRAGKKGPKILVFGDVDAFSNQLVRQVPSNAQLLMDALGWLAE